ncbi:MAG TPA: hypothetical protein VL068_12755, partial [Microthrixaceae bacterium]|nr:hypothetical protein [Microthrixaceae bacterium]
MALRRALLAVMCIATILATPLTGSASAGSLQVGRGAADGVGSSAAAATEDPLGFGILAPARLMDTRSGRKTVDGQANGGGSFKSTRTLEVTGRGGVPANGVGAVVVNVTITTPSSDGYTTVFPTGSSVPSASNVNYAKGQTVANLVVAKVGVDRQISLFNSAAAHVIVDVSGWYSEDDVFS